MEEFLFNQLLLGWILLGLSVFVLLLFVSAPYGRHSKRNWGPMISNKLGWVLMELPSLTMFVFFFFYHSEYKHPITWIFFAIWVVHYSNRALIYPFRTKTKGKQMPLLIALFAVCFNCVNGSSNGYYFAHFSQYNWTWLYDLRFILGMIIFITGVAINQRADQYLLSLRSNGNGYQIPRSRLFKQVSCPNFSGELLEWMGFAIMTWSIAAVGFALWTAFNLIPRAIDHHKWYKKEFPDYPKERKAILPYIL